MACKIFKKYFLILLLVLSLTSTCLSKATFASANSSNTSKDQTIILFINSYDRNNEWTKSIEESFFKTIDKTNITPLYYFEYMSTKKFTGPDYLDKFKELLKEKYRDVDLDYIVTTDDDATLFIAENLTNILEKPIPVIYAGVNNRYDLPNQFYGVLENSDLTKTIELIHKVQGSQAKILTITDKTSTSVSIIKQNNLEQRGITDQNFTLYQSDNPELIIRRLKQNDYDAVIFLLFNKDQLGNAYTYIQGFNLFKNFIHKPIYSTWNFYFGSGMLGGIIVSGEQHGAMAAEILLDLNYGNIPVLSKFEVKNETIFDANVLKSFSLSQTLLPKETVLINVPESYYEKNKTILIIGLLIISVLLGVIYFLMLIVKSKVNQLSNANKRLLEVKNLESIWNMTISVSHNLNTDMGSALTLLSYLSKETVAFEKDFQEERLSKKRLQSFLSEVIDIENQIQLNLFKAVNYIENIKEKSKEFMSRNDVAFDINEQVRFLKNMFFEVFRSNDIQFIYTPPTDPKLNTSVENFREILDILIENSLAHAFKKDFYSPPLNQPKVISLTIHNTATHLELIYKDNGLGLDKERLSHIFDPLYKGDLADPGNGMGMFRLHQIITLEYDGNVTCKSTLNEGLEVKIDLKKGFKKLD